jgi:MFS family permease
VNFKDGIRFITFPFCLLLVFTLRRSEIDGLVMFIPPALCQNIQTMLIARFLSGISASVGATMVGGTISDIFENKDRGTPMNLFGVGSICGTGLGPFIAGFIWTNSKLGWRYQFRLLEVDA